MEKVNLLAAWIGIFFGLLSGIPLGMFFHKEDWLGGYNSWERRLLRLGHVSFFGLASVNFAFVATVAYLKPPESALALPSILFVIALVAMPTVCFLAAFKKPLRHLFFIPVLTLIGGTGAFIFQGIMR